MDRIEYNVPSDLYQSTSALNDLFEDLGLGRPVDPRYMAVFAVTAHLRGTLVGGVFSAPPGDASRALVRAGMDDAEANRVASRMPAVQAIAVREEARANGVGTELLEKSRLHARREYEADFLVARVDADDDPLQAWYKRRDFTVCGPDEAMAVQGVLVPPTPRYVDAWCVLTNRPRVSVEAVAVSKID